MIIYPTIQKDKHSEIYSWLTNQFITVVKESNLCVIIGYSLRDKDIRDNIVESVKNNKNLFILIISPNATSRADYFRHLSEEELSRIGYFNESIENMFLDGKLYKHIKALKGYISSHEQNILITYTSSKTELKTNFSYNTNMENMIRTCIENGFETRAVYLFASYQDTMHENNANAMRYLLKRDVQ